jgi:hypothetical protein
VTQEYFIDVESNNYDRHPACDLYAAFPAIRFDDQPAKLNEGLWISEFPLAAKFSRSKAPTPNRNLSNER